MITHRRKRDGVRPNQTYIRARRQRQTSSSSLSSHLVNTNIQLIITIIIQVIILTIIPIKITSLSQILNQRSASPGYICTPDKSTFYSHLSTLLSNFAVMISSSSLVTHNLYLPNTIPAMTKSSSV